MRVILADDAVLFREALAAGVTARGHEVVGQVADGVALLAAVNELQPDVAIIDIRMPPTYEGEGLKAALRIRASGSRTAVLLLSQYTETGDIAQLLGDNPSRVGYLLKDRVANLAELDGAIRRVGSGGSVIDTAVVTALLARTRRHSPLDELTSRERDILAMMAEGRTNRAIAAAMDVNIKTIEGHVAMVFAKLSLEPTADDNRRVLAVITYLRAPDNPLADT
jgi:serine/threonine-protein kinase